MIKDITKARDEATSHRRNLNFRAHCTSQYVCSSFHLEQLAEQACQRTQAYSVIF